jgi:mRNA-degrading endonuclease YafQ of YafQ-DinJ toxin-antitoxin module
MKTSQKQTSIKIIHAPSFLRDLKKFNPTLREEAFVAIEKFQNPGNHKSLKVHKLKGRLRDNYSFSINYSHRIIFQYIDKNTIALLLAAGEHSLYERFY